MFEKMKICLRDEHGETQFYTQLLDHIRRRMQTDALQILRYTSDPGNVIDAMGRTLLHYAAENANNQVIEYLLDSGANIDAQDCQGKTPLMLGLNCHFAVKILLERNANIHLRDEDGKSVLQLLLDDTDLAFNMIVRKLSDNYSGDSRKIAKTLIDSKCTVYAAIPLRNSEVTRLMLEHGCSINSRELGSSALYHAIYLSDLENVKALLDHGVDMKAESSNLFDNHLATVYDREPEILRSLRDRGARFMRTNNNGEIQISGILKSCKKETIQMLFDGYVGLYTQDAYDRTVLHYMTQNEQPNIFDVLKGEDSYDVNVRDWLERTPLHFVVPNNLSTVIFLLNAGAEVDAEDYYGITPLMYVWNLSYYFNYLREENFIYVSQKYGQVIEYLLQHGANPQKVVALNRSYYNLSYKQDRLQLYSMKSVLAHLVLNEARGTRVEEFIRNKIAEDDKLREQFDMCKLQLEEMKKDKVSRYLSLYDLMIESEAKIERFARNEQLLINLRRFKYQNKYLPYYCYVLRDRLVKAVQIMRMRKMTAHFLCEVIGWHDNSYTLVVSNIVEYLTGTDLRNMYCSK